MTKALEQDLPDGLPKSMRRLIVIPDRTAKLLFWEWGPDIGPIETRMLYYRVFSTYVIRLCVLLVAVPISQKTESPNAVLPHKISYLF